MEIETDFTFFFAHHDAHFILYSGHCGTITLVSSEGSGESAHMRKLTKSFAARIH